MKKALFVLFMSLPLVVSAIAADGVYEPQTEKVTVKAKGLDADDALYNALSSAVSRVNGMALNPAGAYVRQWDVKGGYQAVEGGVNVDARLTQTRMTKDVINERFEGYIKTYNIVSEKQVDGHTEITVDVEVFKYVHPLGDTTDLRVRVTINDFQNDSGGASSISSDLVSELNKKLTSTGKFNVLDRKYLRDFALERNIMLSDDAALSDKARLAMVCGTDVMISGTVRDFRLKNALRPEHRTNRKLSLYEAKVKIDYSLIIPATLQTRISDTVEFTLSPEEVRKLYEITTPADLDVDVADVEAAIAGIVAEKMIDKITEYAYPVLVAAIQDELVILNEGGGRINIGDRFDVFKKGAEVIDPQTSLSLGSAEAKVATVEVQFVKERMAVTSVVDGDVNDITVASLCRRAQSAADTSQKDIAAAGGFMKDPALAADASGVNFVPKKLAIVPVGYNPQGFQYLGSHIAGAEVAANFEQYLATSLRRTGKFDLLDRRYDSAVRKEIQLMLDGSPVDELLAKLDRVSSADYLLVGKISDFTVSKDSIFLEAASMQAAKYSANLFYEYRIIELATRQIVFTGTVNLYYDDDQIKTLVPELNYSDKLPQGENQIKYVLESIAARNVAGGIVDEMYPILVIAAEGDTVVVSTGSSALKIGQELAVFKQGEQLKDPYTGSPIGRLQTELGRVVVTRVEPGMAYAKIVSGEPAGFVKGSVCKPNWQEMAIKRSVGKTSSIRRTPGGGVVLPVDEK